MQPKSRPRSPIPPKLHTIPRENSEAAEQLELYKKVTKRQRILQELHSIEQRTQLLKQQLSIIDSQIEEAEETIKTLRQASLISASSSPASAPATRARAAQKSASAPKTPSSQKSAPPPKSEEKSSKFETFYFEF
jgi:chromosome segregation ATPase